ncbi:hypothetical protein BLGI_4649 [Brevibacillus laterosporus GI-9]|nr:hypothetical protein BLGI_4649 [Brevibacillus laterosporus GI-9]
MMTLSTLAMFFTHKNTSYCDTLEYEQKISIAWTIETVDMTNL